MKTFIFNLAQQIGPLPIIILVMGLFLVHFIFKLYQGRKYHLKELKALGLYQDETKDIFNNKTGLKEKIVSSSIKVNWKKNKLIFSKYNRALGVNDFEAKKSILENLFNTKIELITHEKQWLSSQPKIILHTEVFPDSFSISDRPKLKVGQLYLGMDSLGRNVILEAKKDFENTLMVLAPKGSGKSVLLNNMIISFFETLEENKVSDEYELIIADNKGTDFIGIIKRFNGSYYQPFNLEELRELVQKLNSHKREIEATLAYLKKNGISPRHWDEIRGKINFPVPSKKLIVFDEFMSYWGTRNPPKISKDPTDNELRIKEQYDLCQELGRLTNFFAEQCRSTGIILCCASQSPNKGDYDYPSFVNFPILALGQTNAQMSISLIGDTSLNDNSLTRGKFVIRDGLEARRFLAPL